VSRADRVKTVHIGHAGAIHIETELGIINIYLGLTDVHGRRVEAVQMIPNALPGELAVTVENGRFVEAVSPDRFSEVAK
jgi:hypothetical protein